MRILQLMASGARGGGAEHVLGILEPLRDAGATCVLAVGDDGPTRARALALTEKTVALDIMKRRLSLRAVSQVRDVIESSKADIVHAHGTRGALAAVLASIGWRAPPLVYTAHGLSYRKPWPAIALLPFVAAEGFICRRAEQVISVSRADLQDLHSRHLLKEDRGVHVPNAVAFEKFTSLSTAQRVEGRQRLGLPEHALVFGSVSRLVPQKALHDMIAAFSCFLKRASNDLAPAHLLVVGEGPLRADLEAQIQKLKLEAHCHLIGARDNIPELLGLMDIFLLSSHWEGEPIALLEAFAAGLPTVVTETSGVRDMLFSDAGLLDRVKHAVAVVPIGDTQAFADSMLGLGEALCKNETLHEKAATLVRGLVAERSYLRVAEHLMQVYRDTLG